MSERAAPVDLLEFVGERGRQYVLPQPSEPTPAADVAELAGDPDRRYVATAPASGRQRAWLVCVLLLALGLPALVVTYGYNRGAAPAEAAAAPTSTESSLLASTSESRVTTESTVRRTTSTTEEPTTTSTTAAPTTTSSVVITSTTTAVAPTTTVLAATAVQAPAPTTTAAPTTTTTVYVAPPPPAPASGEAAFLACVRQRESGGNYGAVSPDGLYRGAYQFHQATWNNTASMAGRPDLVGVLPNLASPADQDLLAVTLYRAAGAAPWGGYCA